MSRIWDPEEKYAAAVIKEYTHWFLEVSFQQHTIGSYMIFAKRPIQKLVELNAEEFAELQQVMKDAEGAIIALFSPLRFNYCQLGNSLHHLHFHCIPRYDSERSFGNKKWTDPTPTHVPTWATQEEKESLIIQLRDTIKKEMDR